MSTVEIIANPAQTVEVVAPGPKGDGVPEGGVAAQVLVKNTGTNFDTSWHTLVKADVGLGNADNTSDANKPVSTAQQNALNGKEPTIAAGTLAQYWRGDKSWQDLFADVRAATLTGLSTATNAVIAATDTVLSALGKLQKQVSDNKAATDSHAANTANPHAVTKAQVGLANADNTSDANKPVSTAQQTALNSKADLAGATFTGNVVVTTTGASHSLEIKDTGANGVSLQLSGNGATTPNKFIRAFGGALEFLNSAYAAVIVSINDLGRIFSAGLDSSNQINVNMNSPAISNGSFSTAQIQLKTTDGSYPVLGFHRSGNTAISLYHDGNRLRTIDNMGTDRALLESNTDIVVNSVRTTSGNIGNNITPSYGYHQLGGSARLQGLGTPSAPTVANVGAAGTTAYTYYVVAEDRNGKRTVVSAAGSTATGNAVLDATNYNTISWTVVGGAVKYYVLKANTTTLLGSTTGTSLNDQGQATSSFSPEARDQSADLEVDGQVLAIGFRAAGGTPNAFGTNGVGYSFKGVGDTDGGMYSSADGQLEWYTNAVERMRLDTAGNLLIGGLYVGSVGADGPALMFPMGGSTQHSGIVRSYIPAGAAGIDFVGLRFTTNNGGTNTVDAMRIDPAGNLLVGTTSAGNHRIYKNVAENADILNIGTPTIISATFRAAGGAGFNAAATAVVLNANSTTSRSINAGGTINASGADYAEYMRKSATCGVIAKGQIVGVNTQGELTDKWVDSVSFLVKSTDPSYVGGDVWGTESALGMTRPVEPQFAAPPYTGAPNPGDAPTEPAPLAADASAEQKTAHAFAMDAYAADKSKWDADKAAYDADMAAHAQAVADAKQTFDTVTYPQYQSDLANFNAVLEAARQKVDRIAYAGQVPVNVLGATPGDHIVPVQDGTGIKGIAVPDAAITFEQYRKAVGIVQNILPDGRANVRVKVA